MSNDASSPQSPEERDARASLSMYGIRALQIEDAAAAPTVRFRERLFTLQQDVVGTPTRYPRLDEHGAPIVGVNGKPVLRDDSDKEEVFVEMCSAAGAAFPAAEMSDAEIRQHPATAELVRYVLESFARVAGAESSTDAAIVKAFRAKNGPGGFRKLGTLRNPMVVAARTARAETRCRHPGDEPAAYQAGLEAAYVVYRDGEKDVQDATDMRKAKKRIWPILAWELSWPATPPKPMTRGQKRGT